MRVILLHPSLLLFFFFNDPAPTEIYTLSLHDALPIYRHLLARAFDELPDGYRPNGGDRWWFVLLRLRSEEHTSELQSRFDLVCRLLLEKKKKRTTKNPKKRTRGRRQARVVKSKEMDRT